MLSRARQPRRCSKPLAANRRHAQPCGKPDDTDCRLISLRQHAVRAGPFQPSQLSLTGVAIRRSDRPIPVVVPPHKVLAAYENIVRPLFHRLVVNVKEDATLVRTRDLLLPKLISGDIRLRDAESMVRAVA